MNYDPILIEEWIAKRPREIPTSEELEELGNKIIQQHNNKYAAIVDLLPKYQDCINAYNALTVVVDRKIDGLVAGVMPDGSVTWNKIGSELQAELNLIGTQITALNLLASSIDSLFNKLNTIESSNRADIGGLL